MSLFFNSIFYILVFISLYVQVFLFVTFLENRKKIVTRKGKLKLAFYPAVTIIVPCWNEEKTIFKTVNSLINLNYPKEKLTIFLINDGSSDNTLEIIKTFEKYSNIKVFTKENGGKHTALNLGLENLETDYVGCLDADSEADPESLVRLMSSFEKDPELMAIAPSIVVTNPKSLIQYAQRAEYYMAIYVKKMLGFLGAIHVTPGPLTIFKRKVFDDLGPYRHAHNTEDMEIAYRMQENHYKIDQCNDAYVYTNTPPTVYKLYVQRLRWIYGFLNNTLDYKKILFNKKYGNFSTFTVPAGIVSILAVSYLFFRLIYLLGKFLYNKFIHFQISGFNFGNLPTFDPFFINTNLTIFIAIILYLLVIFSVFLGRSMVNSRNKGFFPKDMILLVIIFSVTSPFWLMRALFNTVINKKPSWR